MERLRLAARHQRAVAVLGGAGIGFYDGLVGPGTGSFLVFLLVGAVGSVVPARERHAKVVNTMTNLAALVLFAAGGHVLWALGAAMAVANLAGSQLGTRLALRRGSALGASRLRRRRHARWCCAWPGTCSHDRAPGALVTGSS